MIPTYEEASFSDLYSQTIESIEVDRDNEVIFFNVALGSTDKISYRMSHYRECCESVVIEDICGELEWLIGEPILRAEERINHDPTVNKSETLTFSETWTFYELATIKGSVTIRWYGESNGYYSEKVSFERILDE